MNIKIECGALIILLIISMLPSISGYHADSISGYHVEPSWWDRDWKYRQEIVIPTVSDTQYLKNQPIDVRVVFKNKCWTKNVTSTSIRVCQWDGVKWRELESQIYNLKFSKLGNYLQNYLQECNIVFLIPGDATGKEKYYVYYDDSEKPETKYPDHVNVEENFLYQEPIPGQKVDVDFYAVKQDGYYIYYVAKEGKLLGQSLSQNVVKLVDGTKRITANSLELSLQLCYSYYYGCTDNDFSSTAQKLVSSKIDIDGNLMVKFTISSESKRGEIRTTNTYTYYYCPVPSKRIRAHVRHEVLQELNLPDCVSYWDGSYGALLSFKFKSNAIKEINFGKIYPYLHIYADDDTIKEYTLDENPYYKTPKRFLMNKEDVDLGKQAWISFDEPGKAHAVILTSNKNIVRQGEGERDGIQVKGYQVELVNMPGLEADFTQVHLMRNAYENNTYDKQIPGNFIAEFDAEFFTCNNYKQIGKEAEAFQALSNLNPSEDKNPIENSKGNNERFKLTVFAHLATSFPLGNPLSVLTGRNFSYISAELYREGKLVSTGVIGRIKIRPEVEYGKTFLKNIRILDLRNSSVFKKIEFENLPKGKYVVKVYREHPLFKKKREIIGLETVDLKENTTLHIFCRRTGSVKVSIFDQNKNKIENARVCIFLDNYCVAKDFTDENGTALINLPYKKKPYELKVFYNGFKIYEKSFKLLKLHKPIEFSLNIPLYSIKFRIVDVFGLTPGVRLMPTLRSLEAEEAVILKPTEIKDGTYLFDNLISSTYEFKVDYKTFKIEKSIEIPSKRDVIVVEFPAKFRVNVHVFDSFGIPLGNAKVYVSRNTKSLEGETNNEGIATFLLPPGYYIINSFENKLKLLVTGGEEINLVTEKAPYTLYSIILLIGIVVATLLFLLKKIPLHVFIKVIPILLLIAALFMPWWQLTGANHSIFHEINVYPWSQKIISKTTIEGNSFLEISTVPDVVNYFLLMVLLLSILCIVCIALSMVFDGLKSLKKKRMEKVFTYGSILLLIIVISVFIYGMNQLSSIGVGGLTGEGKLSINLPYTAEYVDINASWYLSTGFYLCILSIFFLIIPRFLINNLHSRK